MPSVFFSANPLANSLPIADISRETVADHDVLIAADPNQVADLIVTLKSYGAERIVPVNPSSPSFDCDLEQAIATLNSSTPVAAIGPEPIAYKGGASLSDAVPGRGTGGSVRDSPIAGSIVRGAGGVRREYLARLCVRSHHGAISGRGPPRFHRGADLMVRERRRCKLLEVSRARYGYSTATGYRVPQASRIRGGGSRGGGRFRGATSAPGLRQ